MTKNLKNGEKIYIHCKGGHGRSGVVVACLLCNIFKINPTKSIQLTNEYHNQRTDMKEKWRKIGSPQTAQQKTFVYKMFKDLFFCRAHKKGNSVGFSNFSLHPVEIPELGKFPTSEAAFQAFKNPKDKEYIIKQQNAKSPYLSRTIGYKTILRSDWDEVKEEILENIFRLKIKQNEEIKNMLINTGLRNIIESNRRNVWANIETKNILGEILMKIRNEYYEEE